jgi:hypothetical protein
VGRISLIIDANLLVLFIVGTTDRRWVGRHKRLKAFSLEDFDLLCELIADSSEVCVTPNTLTEASNLLGHIGEPVRTQLFETFRAVISSASEEYLPSCVACEAKGFLRLGLTDAGLIEMAGTSRTILTTDLGLYLAALDHGVSAINFNHLRA